MMNQIQFNKPSVALRISSLLAATAVTAVLLASQLGIANGYNAQADALLAARQFKAVAMEAAASAARRSRS
jgi:hypothetical protein